MRQLFLTLFAFVCLLPLRAQPDYVYTIRGIVTSDGTTPQVGHEVRVTYEKNNPFEILQDTVYTDVAGQYYTRFEPKNGFGMITISVTDCYGIERSQYRNRLLRY